MEVVTGLAGVLAAAVGLAAGLFLLRRPRAGFLALALVAPVSSFLELAGGTVKLIHLVAAALVAGAVLRLLQRRRVELPRRVAPHVALLAGLITYAWVLGGFEGTVFWITQLGSLTLLVVIFWVYHRPEEVRRWFGAFAASLAAANAAVLALIALAPGPARRWFFSQGSEGVRLQGTFESANQLAGPQVLGVPILLFYAVNRRGPLRWAALGGALVGLLVVLGTQSRSAIAALLLGLGLVAVVFLRQHRRALRPALISALAAGLLFFAYVNLPEEVAGFELARVGSSKVDLYDVSLGDIARERFWIFGPVTAALADSPLGFGYTFHADVLYAEQGTYKQPHNFLLKNMLTYGVLGGLYVNLLYLLPAGWILWLAWRRRLGVESPALFVAAGMAAYLGYGLFHSVTNWIYVWLVWGFAVRLTQLELARRRTAAGRMGPTPGGKPRGESVAVA